jgi:hypothetical protein
MTGGSINNLSGGRSTSAAARLGRNRLFPARLSRLENARVPRAVVAMQRYWTSERWIQVTGDEDLAKWLQINGTETDEFGQPTW